MANEIGGNSNAMPWLPKGELKDKECAHVSDDIKKVNRVNPEKILRFSVTFRRKPSVGWNKLSLTDKIEKRT